MFTNKAYMYNRVCLGDYGYEKVQQFLSAEREGSPKACLQKGTH